MMFINASISSTLTYIESFGGMGEAPHKGHELVYKVGPIPLISRVITPLIGVITPGKPIYKAIYRGYNSIYNDRMGPPCMVQNDLDAPQKKTSTRIGPMNSFGLECMYILT